MKQIKENAIAKQKKIIADLRENTSSESSREKAILKLNLILDDYEKDNCVIDAENIHLYYEFMSDEDLKKIFNWSFMSNVFGNRIIYITDIFGWRDNKKVLKLDYWKTFDKYYVKNNDYTRFSFFGIMDTLKPIDEYIKEIKESEAYKNYKLLCQTEIPDYIQIEEFKEVPRDELFSYLNKTIGKKKWRVQTERTNIYGYRINSSNNNKIVGLMIVMQDNSKEENIKYYILNK